MEIEHIKNRHILARKNGTTISHTIERSQVWSKFATKLVTALQRGKQWSHSFEPKCDPPVFDVFYLHKYSHSFRNFNDIIIQLFQKMSVMTMATLLRGDKGWQIHATIYDITQHHTAALLFYACIRNSNCCMLLHSGNLD